MKNSDTVIANCIAAISSDDGKSAGTAKLVLVCEDERSADRRAAQLRQAAAGLAGNVEIISDGEAEGPIDRRNKREMAREGKGAVILCCVFIPKFATASGWAVIRDARRVTLDPDASFRKVSTLYRSEHASHPPKDAERKIVTETIAETVRAGDIAITLPSAMAACAKMLQAKMPSGAILHAIEREPRVAAEALENAGPGMICFPESVEEYAESFVPGRHRSAWIDLLGGATATNVLSIMNMARRGAFLPGRRAVLFVTLGPEKGMEPHVEKAIAATLGKHRPGPEERARAELYEKMLQPRSDGTSPKIDAAAIVAACDRRAEYIKTALVEAFDQRADIKIIRSTPYPSVKNHPMMSIGYEIVAHGDFLPENEPLRFENPHRPNVIGNVSFPPTWFKGADADETAKRTKLGKPHQKNIRTTEKTMNAIDLAACRTVAELRAFLGILDQGAAIQNASIVIINGNTELRASVANEGAKGKTTVMTKKKSVIDTVSMRNLELSGNNEAITPRDAIRKSIAAVQTRGKHCDGNYISGVSLDGMLAVYDAIAELTEEGQTAKTKSVIEKSQRGKVLVSKALNGLREQGVIAKIGLAGWKPIETKTATHRYTFPEGAPKNSNALTDA
jgi:hypothetical protein